jgi:hypothetical protein
VVVRIWVAYVMLPSLDHGEETVEGTQILDSKAH